MLACGHDQPTQPLRLEAIVAFPPKDTIRLALPANTRWCGDRRSLLIESLSPEGSGVMLRLRYRDSLASDSFPIVLPSDTTTVPAAVVGIRFFTQDTPRGYALDSGRVHVHRQGNTLRVEGAGVGVESAIRIRAHLESQDVPVGTDTVPCNAAP